MAARQHRRARRGDVPLAWRNITHDKGRLLRAASGIGFAVLLMLVQLGFRNAFLDSSLALLGSLDGELMIISETKYRLGFSDSFPRRRLHQALAVPGVVGASPLFAEWEESIWKNPQTGESFTVQVVAFDPVRPVLAIPGIEAHVETLKRADTVLMDRRGRRFLGRAEAGLVTELGGRRVVIGGTFDLGPDFVVDGTIVTSDRTFFNIFPDRAANDLRNAAVEIGVLRLADGYDTLAVRDRLRAILPEDVLVVTKDELVALEARFQNDVSPVGPIFLVGILIGFAVGVLIAYQIMFTDLSDFLPQYATLKAIGYTNRYMQGVVLQQALLYALAGFLPAWLLTIGVFAAVRELALLPMGMTVALTLIGALLTLAMCVVSGLIAVRRVVRADPAEVF
jgi:putative ABC transport system permease protein